MLCLCELLTLFIAKPKNLRGYVYLYVKIFLLFLITESIAKLLYANFWSACIQRFKMAHSLYVLILIMLEIHSIFEKRTTNVKVVTDLGIINRYHLKIMLAISSFSASIFANQSFFLTNKETDII